MDNIINAENRFKNGPLRAALKAVSGITNDYRELDYKDRYYALECTVRDMRHLQKEVVCTGSPKVYEMMRNLEDCVDTALELARGLK